MELTTWNEPIRIIQNNLRAIDARGMSVKDLIKAQYEYGSNAIIANAGGLMSWYDSELEEQPHNPYLDFDYVGQVVEEAHKYGMKVLLRLDVSNLSEELAEKHPDWLRRDVDGNDMRDLGMLQDCFNSPMWQSYNFKLLDELFSKYDADGVFYNAVHYGFCHCDVCCQKYYEDTGSQLPDVLRNDTEEGRRYVQYRYSEITKYFGRVKEHLIKLKPDAILTICGNIISDFPEFNCFSGWDTLPMLKVEEFQVSEAVNHSMGMHPKWIYIPGENARIANSIGARSMICLHYALQIGRRSAQTPAQLEYDLGQTVAFGGDPVLNVSGTFDQDDRKALKTLKSFYNYLKNNSDVYNGLKNKAKVALVFSKSSIDYGTPKELDGNSFLDIRMKNNKIMHLQEYRGIYESLVHQHILFDVIHEETINEETIRDYDCLLLSSVTCMSDECVKTIDEYVENGGLALVTGDIASLKNEYGQVREKAGLECLQIDISEPTYVSGYLKVNDKQTFQSFEDIDSVGIMGTWREIAPKDGAEVILQDLYRTPMPKINKPEFAFSEETTDEPGVIITQYGEGEVAVIPWEIGTLFRESGIYENDLIISNLLDKMGFERELYTNAPYSVEAVWGEGAKGDVLHLLNATGIQSKPQMMEIPLCDITLTVKTDAHRAISLTQNKEYKTSRKGEFLEISIPKIGVFEAIHLQG